MICTLCHTHTHGTLCTECTLTLRGNLQRLPRMWASLEAWLAPGRTGAAQYGGRVRRAEAPLPLNEQVLDLRAAGGIVGVLEDWQEAVADTRGVPLPHRPLALPLRVTAAAGSLLRDLPFIALWEHGPQLAREIEQLIARIRAVADPGPDPDAPTFLGYCIAITSGVVCGGPLYADMARTVQCTWCGCPYPPATWLALRERQPGRAKPPSADGRPLDQAA